MSKRPYRTEYFARARDRSPLVMGHAKSPETAVIAAMRRVFIREDVKYAFTYDENDNLVGYVKRDEGEVWAKKSSRKSPSLSLVLPLAWRQPSSY